MDNSRSLLMQLFSYEILEKRYDEVFSLIQKIEDWCGCRFSEVFYSSRKKLSRRTWKATQKNWDKLKDRAKTDAAWGLLGFGWPEDGLKYDTALTKGIQVFIRSSMQMPRNLEAFRSPSKLEISVHQDLLLDRKIELESFLELGVNAWETIQGVYGFVDIVGKSPYRQEHFADIEEWKEWQFTSPKFDKKIWKVFWGNFLGRGHFIELARKYKMIENPVYAKEEVFLKAGYQKVKESCNFEKCLDLPNNGLLITTSSSPFNLSNPNIIERTQALQKLVSPISVKLPS